ncbi:MAG: hypothetical protein N2511_00145 [Thermodesulfovibrionales bacterium]|nr:hypothetical protein [Thermodesulfovibrionales bacterium]
MLLDLRGLDHPQHLQEFKKHFEGLCTVYEDVEVLLSNNKENIKKFEIFISFLRAQYTIDFVNDFVKLRIIAPFSLCG